MKSTKNTCKSEMQEDGLTKVYLKSFKDSKNKRIKPPKIKYLDINNISDNDIEELRSFIRLKQIYAPAEFTKDEIEIGNKIYSVCEINKINSEREGLNYRNQLFTATFLAIVSGGFLYLLPCLIIFGVGLAWMMTIVIAVTVLRKTDATKKDRKFAYFILGLVVVVLIIYFVRFIIVFD